MTENIRERGLAHELEFQTSRSTGPGGQNVNKLNTKVELRFNIINSKILNEEEKTLIFSKLSRYINKEGELLLSSQESRSQLENKITVTEKFYLHLEAALKEEKGRIKTRIPKEAKKKRLEEKQKRSRLKKDRNWDTQMD